jgi:hypothetical protein
MTHYQGTVPDTRRTPDWRDDALCASPDYADHRDLWFPLPGDKAAAEMAKAICKTCPVLAACLAAALDEEGTRGVESRHGIRGALSPRGRRARYEKTRKAQPPETPTTVVVKPVPKKREPAQCGTRPGYQRHLREHTAICGPCRQANTDADNRLRRTGTTKAVA